MEKKQKKHSQRKHSSSSSSTDEWVEVQNKAKRSSSESSDAMDKTKSSKRDDWMTMTNIKTYKKEIKEKKEFKTYNPGTNSREINPYWKDGGVGVPQTADEYKKSKKFMKPNNDGDYYRNKSYTTYDIAKSNKDYKTTNERKFKSSTSDNEYYRSLDRGEFTKQERDEDTFSPRSHERDEYGSKSYNWKRGSDIDKQSKVYEIEKTEERLRRSETATKEVKMEDEKYLSDEKMNKLAAKLIKAEIMGDTMLVSDLKSKLEAARQYRKNNPLTGEESGDQGIMLTATSSTGSSRPLSKSYNTSDNYNRKRKSETHRSGERMKYFGNDDKFTLSQMVEEERYGNNYDNDAQLAKIAGKHKNPNDDLEDIFTSEISKNVSNVKEDARARQKAINEHNKIERTLEGCEYCIDSKNMLKHLMVSCGSKVYLTLPARKSLVQGHCIITTLQHLTCVTALDEDVWEEVMDYRRALTQYYNSLDMDVVFFETATNLNRYPHMVINCVPLPRDVGETAPIYFKKALLECEAEWAMNKKIIDLKGKNIRKGVPKGLPYFWIDFGMTPGFAHVIEDLHLFPKNFAQEIIGGILDLDHSLWKKPQKEYGDQQRKKVLEFIQTWKPFDTLNKR